ncbi:MAG: N-acetyl-gamma-glutamyl-phosphate reductase [Pseudomonadota bacterium]
MYKVFIDGQAGTTGLKIQGFLQGRPDLVLLEIDEAHRKSEAARRELVNEADIVLLCLPDDAAREAVALANNNTRFIDASTAHRVNPDWTYGLPELAPGQRKRIAGARYVSNPGCYPTGFLLAIAPLVRHGDLRTDIPLTISALSGYTGGGRQMVADYEARAREHPDALWYSRPYALHLDHKHLPEMQRYAGLEKTPLFLPSVGHFAQGMLVSIPLAAEWFKAETSVDKIAGVLTDTYAGEPCVVTHSPNDSSLLENGQLEPQANNNTNRVDLFVFGNRDRFVLVARLDNLGKGAGGAAVQNLNLMLGIDELHGLSLQET